MKTLILFVVALLASASAQVVDGGSTGSGSGTVSSGTVNTVPKYTAATTVGNSSITDNGSTVSTAETIAAGGVGLAGATHTFSLLNGSDVANAAGAVTTDVSGNIGVVAPGSNGNVLTSNGTIWTSAAAAGGGITNGAGNNIITKSNGTNLVASGVADDGSTVTLASEALTLTNGNLSVTNGTAFTSTLKSNGSNLTISNLGGFGSILLSPEWHIENIDSVQVSPPTVHAATCGTSPSITSGSTDNAIEVVVGTGGVATSCQVDFGRVFAKNNITHPICTANSETDKIGIAVSYSTGASVILTATAAFTASSKISVLCF